VGGWVGGWVGGSVVLSYCFLSVYLQCGGVLPH